MVKKKTISRLSKVIITALPLALAVFIVVYLMANKPNPTTRKMEEETRTLRIIQAPSVDLIPRTIGYGVAEPGRIWEAIAEIEGPVSSTHRLLKSGEIIRADSVLIQLDPTEYELAVTRLEASIQETQAKIKELAEDEENTKRLVAVEQRSLELAGKSLERKLGILKRQAISQDEVDREERNYIQQKQNVQRLENALSLIPSKRKALSAALSVQQVNLKEARINLAKTKITAPFDIRLSDVKIEPGQFVRAGQLLFKGHGTAATEIEARFRLEELGRLLSNRMRESIQPGLGSAAFKQMFKDISVIVTLQSVDWAAEWTARIDRVREAVDFRTREMRIVVAVDNPYGQARPGVRPPLAAGMFCRVELLAPARLGSVIVPRSSIRGDKIFTLDKENRLREKQVTVDFAQSEFVVIKSGLQAEETVVVSDPSPAILGMKVNPVPDVILRKYLIDTTNSEKIKK